MFTACSFHVPDCCCLKAQNYTIFLRLKGKVKYVVSGLLNNGSAIKSGSLFELENWAFKMYSYASASDRWTSTPQTVDAHFNRAVGFRAKNISMQMIQ